MPAAQYDFANGSCDGNPLEVGATFSNQLIWQKEDTVATALAQSVADAAALLKGYVADKVCPIYAPVDITGYTAKMQVRKKPGAPLVLEMSTQNGRITFTPLTGIINIVVQAADTALLVPGLYRYDLDLTDQAGFVTRFIQGAFEIVETITT